LWTNPTAKKPTIDNRKQGNEHNKKYHAQRENEEILGPEYFPKQDEPGIQDIDEE